MPSKGPRYVEDTVNDAREGSSPFTNRPSARCGYGEDWRGRVRVLSQGRKGIDPGGPLGLALMIAHDGWAYDLQSPKPMPRGDDMVSPVRL
jgi:hypothetical protein